MHDHSALQHFMKTQNHQRLEKKGGERDDRQRQRETETKNMFLSLPDSNRNSENVDKPREGNENTVFLQKFAAIAIGNIMEWD